MLKTKKIVIIHDVEHSKDILQINSWTKYILAHFSR